MQFFTVDGVGQEIHRRMSAVYGKHSMSCSRVLEWHKRFHMGCVSLQDDAQHPPYSPDLFPCDFHIFEELVCGHHFASGQVKNSFGRQPTSKSETDYLVSQWDKCINSVGD